MTTNSTKPYLIRAIHEWCSDQGHTPYLAVAVDEHTRVPMEYVKAGEIVLNVSLTATNRLRLGNDWIEFQARFGGVARDISIPISNVSAIYARETGHGMAFEVSKAPAHVDESLSQAQPTSRSSQGNAADASTQAPALALASSQPSAEVDEASKSASKTQPAKRMRSVGQRRQNTKPVDQPTQKLGSVSKTSEDERKDPGPTLSSVEKHSLQDGQPSSDESTASARTRGGARSGSKPRPKLTRVK